LSGADFAPIALTVKKFRALCCRKTKGSDAGRTSP
jgi:hypothetical protein